MVPISIPQPQAGLQAPSVPQAKATPFKVPASILALPTSLQLRSFPPCQCFPYNPAISTMRRLILLVLLYLVSPVSIFLCSLPLSSLHLSISLHLCVCVSVGHGHLPLSLSALDSLFRVSVLSLLSKIKAFPLTKP